MRRIAAGVQLSSDGRWPDGSWINSATLRSLARYWDPLLALEGDGWVLTDRGQDYVDAVRRAELRERLTARPIPDSIPMFPVCNRFIRPADRQVAIVMFTYEGRRLLQVAHYIAERASWLVSTSPWAVHVPHHWVIAWTPAALDEDLPGLVPLDDHEDDTTLAPVIPLTRPEQPGDGR